MDRAKIPSRSEQQSCYPETMPAIRDHRWVPQRTRPTPNEAQAFSAVEPACPQGHPHLPGHQSLSGQPRTNDMPRQSGGHQNGRLLSSGSQEALGTTEALYGQQRDLGKGLDDYRRRRERNNIAVRKSRERAKKRFLDIEMKLTELNRENITLRRKVDLLTREMVVLKSLLRDARVTLDSVDSESLVNPLCNLL